MTHRIIIRNNSTDQSYSPRWSTIENIVAEEREGRPDAVLTLRMILDLAAAHWYGRNCTFFRNRELLESQHGMSSWPAGLTVSGMSLYPADREKIGPQHYGIRRTDNDQI